MLVNVLWLIERREAHALMAEQKSEAKPRSRATVGSRVAGLPLDGGGSAENRGLSAGVVTHLLYVFGKLAFVVWVDLGIVASARHSHIRHAPSGDGALESQAIESPLEEMLFTGGSLNAKLLGASGVETDRSVT